MSNAIGTLKFLEPWCGARFNLQAAILDSHDPEENQSTKQTDKRMWFVSISESSHITSDLGVNLQMTAWCQHLIRQHIFIKEKLRRVTRYHVYYQEMKCSQKNGKENSIQLVELGVKQNHIFSDKHQWVWHCFFNKAFCNVMLKLECIFLYWS